MDENTMGNDYYTLTDEDGNELEFEMIGQCEYKGAVYYAMIPADSDDDGEFCEYTILKSVMEDGEEILVSVDDDDEFDDVADYFDDLFSQEIDYDASEDGEEDKSDD
ncbi:MAG: DUF1292 domain-containing protein [Eubacteriales bacterium]